MIAINRSINFQYRSCWKYLTWLASTNVSHSPSLDINRSFKLTIRSNHSNNNQFFFISNHNEYYHSLLSKNKKYAATMEFLDYTPAIECPTDMDSILSQDFENEPLMKLVTYIQEVLQNSHHSPEILENVNFVRLCKTLVSKIDGIHNDHLINLLNLMVLWSTVNRNVSFFEICNAIDKVSLSRYRIWGLNRCLLVMDYFYRLHFFKEKRFVWKCMERLWRNPEKLTSSQLVHALFLVSVHRAWHPSVNVHNLERCLYQNIHELSTEECAIIAFVLVKTQTKIRDMKLLNVLYEKLNNGLSTIDSIPLSDYLKAVEKQQMLQKRLTNLIDKHNYLCCIRILSLGTDMLIRCPENMDKIAARFVSEISTLRLKDIERTILAFAIYNYEPKINPNPFELASIELMKRENEAFDFPTSFYSAINYLCLKGLYNHQLIDKVLSEDFLKKVFKWKETPEFACTRNLLLINNSVQIDCPEYAGNLLNPILVQKINERQTWKLPKATDRTQTNFSIIMLDAKSLLEKMFGGPEFVHFTFVLPHFSRPDLLFHLVDHKPVKLPDSVLSKNYVGVELPSKSNSWYVLTYFGTKTTIYGTDEPGGYTAAKLRHLKKIGYKVLCLRESKWTKIAQKNRIEYLIQLIEESQVKQSEE